MIERLIKDARDAVEFWERQVARHEQHAKQAEELVRLSYIDVGRCAHILRQRREELAGLLGGVPADAT